MSDPVTIRGKLTEKGNLLDEANRKRYELQEAMDELAERYDDIFNDFLVAFVAPYEEEDGKLKRLPGEDVRAAIITKQIREQHPQLFGEYRRKRAELERANDWVRSLEKSISSYQSQLKSLTVEMQAVGA